MPLPLPHALDKLLAPHLQPRLALAAQLAVHHHLCSDPGVIRPRQPERDKPAHAMPAHEDIHLRLVQHVPHVQPPGHVRRRQQQRKHRPRVGVGRTLLSAASGVKRTRGFLCR